MPWVGLNCVMLVFPGHTHSLFSFFEVSVYFFIRQRRTPPINVYDAITIIFKVIKSENYRLPPMQQTG